MKTLNVKDPEAHRLAQAISQTTGDSITRVVMEALREKLDRLQSQSTRANADELLAIAKRISDQRKGPYLDHAELLYDENGLPK